MADEARHDGGGGASDRWFSTRVGGVQIGAYVSEYDAPKAGMTIFWAAKLALPEFIQVVSEAEQILGGSAPDRVLVAYGETKETHRTASLATRLASRRVRSSRLFVRNTSSLQGQSLLGPTLPTSMQRPNHRTSASVSRHRCGQTSGRSLYTGLSSRHL